MKLNTLSDKIQNLEKRLKIDSLFYKEEALWPLLRNFILLSRPKTNQNSGGTLRRRVIFLLQGLKEFFKWKFGLWPKAKNAFLTSSHYKVKEDNVFYDRIIDPFLEELKNRNKDFIVFEFTGNFSYSIKLNYSDKVIKIQPLLYLLSFIWRLEYFFKSKDHIKNFKGDFQGFNVLSKAEELNFQVDKAFFWRIFLLEKQSILFEKVLQDLEVQKVGVVCYYDFKSLALTWAVNRLGIDSIDIQHGVQGPLHSAYGSWPKTIANNSVFLPTHFWVWDDFSYEALKQWKSSDQIILGCNKWMLDRVTKLAPEIILFTAQPLEDPLPNSLIEGIKKYKGNLKWFIRLHPHQINEMGSFEKLLKAEGIWEKVNLNDATFNPLSDLLSITQVHITKSSSVAIEGSYYNIPTIFLADIAETYYKYQLPPSLQHHLQSDENLEKFITSFENEKINLNQNSKLLNRFYSINNFFK